MLTMNRATLVGHAGRNPEMRKLPSGDEVATFSLATTERFKRRDGTDGEATEWHAIVAFGASAQAVRNLVRRGDPVLVEGRIATRSWTDRKGAEHRTTEIVVSGPRGHVNVLAKRRLEPGGDDEPSRGSAPRGKAEAADAGRADGAADAAAAPASAGTTDTGTREDAGSDSDADVDTGTDGGDADTAMLPEDAASAEAGSAGTEEGVTAAADTTGNPGPCEANRAARGKSPNGSAGDAGTGQADGTDAGDGGDAVPTGIESRSGNAGHD